MSGHPVTMRSTGERWTLGHRPALDGVRGIAVTLVVAFHVGLPYADGGGAVGVAAFFTLSGFLITALLLEEHDATGRISLRAFYERRGRRLLPALLAVTLCVVALVPVLGPRWFDVHSLPAVLLYYGNWLQVTPVDGLAAMGVTWSLAVEEQFYIAWPLLLLIVLRRGRRQAVVIVAMAGAAWSLFVRAQLLADGATQEQIYFPTSTNAFGLLVGAALAAWIGGRPPVRRWPVTVLGMALLLWPVVWPIRVAHEVGPVLAALGTVLVLLGVAGPGSHPVLTFPVLRWLGERSYGIYLIHGPITTLLRNMWGWPTWDILVATVLLTLLLAECSYRWIETPVRRRRGRAVQVSGVMAATVVHEPS